MRSDMSSVLVDTHRYGDKCSRQRRTVRSRMDWESAPSREAMKPRWTPKVSIKQFGENLGPLKNYLVNQVGRHWDKVYAEICEHMDRSNTVQAHIFQHLYGYIAVQCYWKDGVLYEANEGYRPTPVSNPRWRNSTGLYVCPKSGVIRRLKYRPKGKKAQELTSWDVSDFLRFRKVRGLWARELFEYRDYITQKYDREKKVYVSINHGPKLMPKLTGSGQASRTELKKHGLVNSDWNPIIEGIIQAHVPAIDRGKARQYMRRQGSLKNTNWNPSRYNPDPDGFPGMVHLYVPQGAKAAAQKAIRKWL